MADSKAGKTVKRLVTSVTDFYLKERGGREFLETFRKHWPKSVELLIYYEGDKLFDDEENIKWHWFEEIEGWPAWERRLSRFPLMTGMVRDQYDVQHDARHWRKPFACAQVFSQFGGKVFWLDADVVTFKDIPETFLDECLPDDKMVCYLGRKNFYSETGFIGYNGYHELLPHFFRMYLEVFMSGLIFTQPSWHDCQGFDFVRNMINQPELFNDLAKDLPENMHPFVNSVCGNYMDHMKGKRKGYGSWQEDLVVEKEGDYWKDRMQRPSWASPPVTDTDTNSQQPEQKEASSMQPVDVGTAPESSTMRAAM